MSRSNESDDLAGVDKRIQERRRRAEGKAFDQRRRKAAEKLPDLSERILTREPEELEAFQREFLAEKKLREQRIAKQVRTGEPRPSPQAEPLPGDTRD
jgi:hypothetical protein